MTHTNQLNALMDKLITKVSRLLEKRKRPILTESETAFFDDTQNVVLPLLDKLATENTSHAYKQACLVFLAQALTNLRYHYERHEVWAKRLYTELAEGLLARVEYLSREDLLCIMQAFYEARLEVPEAFKELSMEKLADIKETEYSLEEMRAHGQALVESFFTEHPTLTAFELSDILFESLHALPAEAAQSMIVCLTENQRTVAQEAAVLFLLHPKPGIRELTINTLIELYAEKLLTPVNLRRLVTIRQWWPEEERKPLDTLIAAQRKREGQFADIPPPPDKIRYEACLFDGSGVQMIFIETEQGKNCRLGGFLVKHEVGIRDAWMTSVHMPEKELRSLRRQLQKEQPLPLSQVSEEYVAQIASHFMALNNRNKETPEPHFLEIYELLGAQAWRAEPTKIDECLLELFHEINPGMPTEKWINESLERSGDWTDYEAFTESWFETSPGIDALINRHTSLNQDRPKIKFDDALHELSTTGFEYVRQKWVALFFWMALMTKSCPNPKKDLLWEDFATLAYVLNDGMPMQDIPLMQCIIHDSLSISIDSIHERGSHLQ